MIDPGARGDVAPSRVLIVDDHPLVRLGLETRINAQSDLAVCGQAATTGEALALARALQPALIIVDIALKDGDGIDLIKRLRASGIESRIIAFSAHDERLFGERALRAGAAAGSAPPPRLAARAAGRIHRRRKRPRRVDPG